MLMISCQAGHPLPDRPVWLARCGIRDYEIKEGLTVVLMPQYCVVDKRLGDHRASQQR